MQNKDKSDPVNILLNGLDEKQKDALIKQILNNNRNIPEAISKLQSFKLSDSDFITKSGKVSLVCQALSEEKKDGPISSYLTKQLSPTSKENPPKSPQQEPVNKTLDITQRPAYPDSWLDFEKKSGINKKQDTLNSIDQIRGMQLNENRSFHWFLSMVITWLNTVEQDTFQNHFGLSARVADFLQASNFSQDQLTTIEKLIIEHEKQDKHIIFALQKILKEKEKFLNEVQLVQFSLSLPDEYKWLEFQKEFIKDEQQEKVNELLSKSYSDNKTVKDVAKNIYSKVKLDPNQRLALLSIFDKNQFLDFTEISERNAVVNSKRKKTERTKEPIQKKKKTSDKKSEKKRKGVFDEEENTAKKTKVQIDSYEYGQEDMDNVIQKAVDVFKIKFKFSPEHTKALQKTDPNNPEYLLHKTIISPPAELKTDESKEAYGKIILEHLKKRCNTDNKFNNIILVTKDPDWKKHNVYKNKHGEQIALTIPEDTPVGTVVVRGSTASKLRLKYPSSSDLKPASETEIMSKSITNLFKNTGPQQDLLPPQTPMNNATYLDQDEGIVWALFTLSERAKNPTNETSETSSKQLSDNNNENHKTGNKEDSATREELLARIKQLEKTCNEKEEALRQYQTKNSI